jgi:hypothetical protein
VRPDAPEDLEAICARAMERRPEDRYACAADLLDDLEAHLAARDDRMSMREVGALVGQVFAEERRRMNTLIEETLARVRGGPRSGVMPTLEVHVRGTPSGATGLRDEASQISGQLVLTPLCTAPSISAARATATPVAGTVEAPPWWASRRAAIAAASGATLLLLVVVFLVATFRESTPVERVDARVPAAAAAPAGRDSPDLVDVVVRVSPASAQITIDGMPVPTNPFHARYAKDAQVHRVLAAADGYDAKLEEVFFANDVSIDVSLDRRASQPPPRYVPPAPAPHTGRHAASPSPSPATNDAPAAAAASTRLDIAPTGGHAPLRPIMTSNPYGTP